LWCYGQPWFLNFDLFGTNMQTLFQIHPINLSIAIWVGFLALFGIASDDGVVISTYLDKVFATTASPQYGKRVRQPWPLACAECGPV
jgi:Cu(I)/Ag(I) efflux system membrane protein CusA/SilA